MRFLRAKSTRSRVSRAGELFVAALAAALGAFAAPVMARSSDSFNGPSSSSKSFPTWAIVVICVLGSAIVVAVVVTVVVCCCCPCGAGGNRSRNSDSATNSRSSSGGDSDRDATHCDEEDGGIHDSRPSEMEASLPSKLYAARGQDARVGNPFEGPYPSASYGPSRSASESYASSDALRSTYDRSPEMEASSRAASETHSPRSGNPSPRASQQTWPSTRHGYVAPSAAPRPARPYNTRQAPPYYAQGVNRYGMQVNAPYRPPPHPRYFPPSVSQSGHRGATPAPGRQAPGGQQPPRDPIQEVTPTTELPQQPVTEGQSPRAVRRSFSSSSLFGETAERDAGLARVKRQRSIASHRSAGYTKEEAARLHELRHAESSPAAYGVFVDDDDTGVLDD